MEFRPMHKFAVFLFITCNLVFSVKGRLLKSTQSSHVRADSSKSSDFGRDSVEGYKEDFRPTAPGNSPGVGHSFPEDDEEIVQKPGSINVKHLIAGDKEDFRPTTPGNSPGAGHSFGEDDEDIQKKPASISVQGNGKHSIAGHSPGVGHVYQSKNSEPNA